MAFRAPPEWDVILSAAQKNDPERIRYLIEEKGVDPNHSNYVGQTSVHIASLWGHVEALQELLRFKANANPTNQLTGASPLHSAVQSKKQTLERRVECIRLLLRNGGDPSICDFFQKTPVDYVDPRAAALIRLLQPQNPDIFVAIQMSRLDRLRELLVGDKSLVHSKFKGQTPLLRLISNFLQAAEECIEDNNEEENNDSTSITTVFWDMFRVLVEAGSDPNLACDVAEGPMALEGGSCSTDEPLLQICRALQNAYRNSNRHQEENANPALDNVIVQLEKAAKLLIISGANVSTSTAQVLLDAARRDERQMVRLLIEDLKVDPNARGRQGMTPLQFAARAGKTEMVKYLLSCKGIEANTKDDRGQSALDAARVNNKQDIVELLESFSK